MRKKEGNKERDILNAAIKVFAKNGYHNATVSKIAEIAKVGTGSIYLYFENKQHVLYKIFENLWKNMSDNAEEILNREVDSSEKLKMLIDLLFDGFLSNHHLASLYVKEHQNLVDDGKGKFMEFYKKFLDNSESILRESLNKDGLSSSLDFELLRHFIIGGIRSLIFQHTQQPKKVTAEILKRTVLSIFGVGRQS